MQTQCLSGSLSLTLQLPLFSLLTRLQASPSFFTVRTHDCSLLQEVNGSDSLLCLEAITPCSCHSVHHRTEEHQSQVRGAGNDGIQDRRMKPHQEHVDPDAGNKVRWQEWRPGWREATEPVNDGTRTPRRRSRGIDPIFKTLSLKQC